MFPSINWDLAWTIAYGVFMGTIAVSVVTGTLTAIGRMWQANWKVTVLSVLYLGALITPLIGAFTGYCGWGWLIPGFIVSYICHHIATSIIVKENL